MRFRHILMAFVTTVLVAASAPASADAAQAPRQAVIVRAASPAMAADAVRLVNGDVTRTLDLIDAVAANVDPAQIPVLRALPTVTEVTRDARVELLGLAEGYDAEKVVGSLYNVAKMVKADKLWDRNINGAGVDVALIDSGVDQLPEFGTRLVTGPDISFDATGDPTTDGDDGYGHGTHLAGIIAGRSPAVPLNDRIADKAKDAFVGIAPGSRIVNVKVGASDGAADVSQVIAGIGWVVSHANTDGMNIRVLNLSFGTDGIQNYLLDPLAYAAEAAWRSGIVVVVSAGNDGFGSPKLNNPAYDPYVIAAGASDPNGTAGTSDDTIADFSSRGDLTRRPDFMAPGRSIVSLRAVGSTIDNDNPTAQVGTKYFKGSGTSQSTAVVSGLVALLLDAKPSLTPDKVKAALAVSGVALKTSTNVLLERGARSVDVEKALDKVRDINEGKIPYLQSFPVSTGSGSLDAARGSASIAGLEGVVDPEVDVTGTPWAGSQWNGSQWNGSQWNGSQWNGSQWNGSQWNGSQWNGSQWNGSQWNGSQWNGSQWNGSQWNGSQWNGSQWGDAT